MEWPGWLKCVDIRVGLMSWWWFWMERRCSPKRSCSWRFFSPMRGLVKIENRSRKRSHKLDGIGVGRIRTFPFLPIPVTTPSPMIQWKLGCRSWKQKRKKQPIARPGIEHCHWFILPLLLATPTMQFSLDHKRRTHKQSQFFSRFPTSNPLPFYNRVLTSPGFRRRKSLQSQRESQDWFSGKLLMFHLTFTDNLRIF